MDGISKRCVPDTPFEVIQKQLGLFKFCGTEKALHIKYLLKSILLDEWNRSSVGIAAKSSNVQLADCSGGMLANSFAWLTVVHLRFNDDDWIGIIRWEVVLKTIADDRLLLLLRYCVVFVLLGIALSVSNNVRWCCCCCCWSSVKAVSWCCLLLSNCWFVKFKRRFFGLRGFGPSAVEIEFIVAAVPNDRPVSKRQTITWLVLCTD